MPACLLAGCSTQPSSSERGENLAALPRTGLLPSVFFQDELPSLAPDKAHSIGLLRCHLVLKPFGMLLQRKLETLRHGDSAAPALLTGLMSLLNCFGEDLSLLHDLIVPVCCLVTWLG